jgi:polysaccharide deacetylase family sporulation protein PdaB
MRFDKGYYISKIIVGLSLIFVCGIMSILFNYEKIGVFLTYEKKLPIYSVDTKVKNIALTFDVNWGSDNTNKILDTLDQYNVKATFFIVGAWAEDNEEKVKEIYNRGHEIANHSTKHPDLTKVSRDRIIKEVEITDAKIKELTGESSNIFRCPSGSYNDNVIQTLRDINHFCIQWDVDSIDWKEEGADIEYNRVIKRTKPGSIVLFHNNAKYTPENLPKIIKEFKSQNYNFLKVSQLIYTKNYYINNDGKQILK